MSSAQPRAYNVRPQRRTFILRAVDRIMREGESRAVTRSGAVEKMAFCSSVCLGCEQTSQPTLLRISPGINGPRNTRGVPAY